MPSKINPIVVAFRTTPIISELSEKIAKKKGVTKSEFHSANTIDTAMNFERVRIIDVLSDFLDILLPHLLAQGMDKEKAVKTLTTLQRTYIEERLTTKMRLQKHLTDVAIHSYLQGYTEQLEAEDGFIINQCIQTIYDNLLAYDLISQEEWQEQTNAYELYMEEVGSKLI